MPADPSNQETIRWGIVGTGWIAERFALALAASPEASLSAVASRTHDRANQFAHRHGVSKAYGSYDELVADESIDIVYIATPVTRHREDCLTCLNAGKPVLCEKPFAVSAAEAREVVDVARRESLFCMEAMWMRFHPLVQQARDIVRSGDLGEIALFQAETSTRKRPDPNDRSMRADLCGGALLDLGIYSVSLSHFLFGHPDDAVAKVKMHPLGVDETATFILSYPNTMGIFTVSIGASLSETAAIIGSTGRLDLGRPFISPRWMRVSRIAEAPARQSAHVVRRRGKLLRAIPFSYKLRNLAFRVKSFLNARVELLPKGTISHAPPGVNALRLEAEEAMRCLSDGRTESEIMPLDDTVEVLETMDKLRGAVGTSQAGVTN